MAALSEHLCKSFVEAVLKERDRREVAREPGIA
jgi:hypothetical protein